jgi:hypothetical protein
MPKWNKGQQYEYDITELIKSNGITVPLDLQNNDTGFVYKGVEYFVEVKNKTAPDYGQKGLVWSQIHKWQWRENDSISKMFDAIGVTGLIDPKFVPKLYSVSKHLLTPMDRSADQRAFEQSNIPLTGAGYLHDFYARKNCYYIQIEGKGFYHLQKDIAQLGVPQFDPDLTLRLRAKTHASIPVHHYSFFAVIQANRRSIRFTKYDLEEKNGRIFPPIK